MMTNFTANMIRNLKQQFSAGVPVIVKGTSKTGRETFDTSEVVGTVIGWRLESAGAWYSRNGNPNICNAEGKLQLLRLLLRKVDGEISDLVIDDLTSIARLEAI